MSESIFRLNLSHHKISQRKIWKLFIYVSTTINLLICSQTMSEELFFQLAVLPQPYIFLRLTLLLVYEIILKIAVKSYEKLPG